MPEVGFPAEKEAIVFKLRCVDGNCTLSYWLAGDPNGSWVGTPEEATHFDDMDIAADERDLAANLNYSEGNEHVGYGIQVI
jgi:hypothetical protein